jgi:mannose/fructose/N-acetylgalactosamine-specific phosphotransferase system component IIC
MGDLGHIVYLLVVVLVVVVVLFLIVHFVLAILAIAPMTISNNINTAGGIIPNYLLKVYVTSNGGV